MTRRLVVSLVLAVAADLAIAEEVSTGRYVALMGDCAACHTAPGGKAFAGGLAIPTPFGEIYSSNITSDLTHGIGGYTLEQFDAAVRRGIRRDGANLYPAMPYPSFAKVSDEDIAELYNFIMDEIEPVAEPAPKTELGFPFSQRWEVGAWNLLNRPPVGFTPPFEDVELDRGAYLVEGLGHCGACHTPRDKLFAEQAYDSTGAAFLTGGMLANWPVPDLRGPGSAPQRWSEEALVEFLTTGRNADSGVTGRMTLVVEHSLQYATETDIVAIARYLKAIGREEPVGSDTAKADVTTVLLTAAQPDMPIGARLYFDNCGACHTVSGRGAPRTIPSLVGNSLVTAQDPGGLISVILRGARMPSTRSAPAALAMPGFADRLSDSEVAALASFVRDAWTNSAAPVDTSVVSTIRSGQ